mgnify:CR=1 FL=1
MYDVGVLNLVLSAQRLAYRQPFCFKDGTAASIGRKLGAVTQALKNLNDGIATPWYVWFFYVLNFLMVLAGIIIYYRNKKLDKERENA